MAYVPHRSNLAAAAASTGRHAAAAAATHAAVLRGRHWPSTLSSAVAAVPSIFERHRYLPKAVIGSCFDSPPACPPSDAASPFAAAAAAAAAIRTSTLCIQHHSSRRRAAAAPSPGWATVCHPAVRCFSAVLCHSRLPLSAAAGARFTAPLSAPHDVAQLNSSCCSSRCVSSSSSGTSGSSGGGGSATGARSGSSRSSTSHNGQQQQQKEDAASLGASRAPGATGSGYAAAAGPPPPPPKRETAAAPSGAAMAARTTEEDAAAAAGRSSRKPHKQATPSGAAGECLDAQEAAADDEFAAVEEKYRVCLEEVEAVRRKAEGFQDKALRALADMENARVRHQKELARTKEYAAADFAKAMLEVADSLAFATKALHASLPQQQQAKEEQEEEEHQQRRKQERQQHFFQQQQQVVMGGSSSGAPGLHTSSSSSDSGRKSSSSSSLTIEQLQHIYEGVAMTEALLHRTLDKFGVQQYDPTGEVFNPAVHEALFEIDDPTKEKGRVAQVIQMGYKIKDRVLRAAKVGVSRGGSSSSNSS